MVGGVQAPDRLDIVPEHVADPVRRAPWPARLRTALGDGLLSLILNVAVVAGMVGAGWPLRVVEAPQPISVDLVDHVPSGAGKGGETAADAAEAAATDKAVAEPEAKPDPAAPSADPPSETPPAKAEAPAPATQPPSSPTPQPSPVSEPASEPPTPPATAAPAEPPPPDVAAPQAAAPPPPEHPDATPEARLVEAPQAPQAETAHTNPDSAPAAMPSAAAPQPAPEAPSEPPAAPPQVLSAPAADDSAPAADAVPAPPKPLTAEEKRQAETTARLAAILPFGANITADPFQAQAASQAQATSDSYRGAVYANFNKAQDVIAAAQAKHLKGQTVVAFTVDDRGALQSLGVAVSSGKPAVDAAALDLIRHAAPFPPPPPGAQRAFSPAIRLGLDD